MIKPTICSSSVMLGLIATSFTLAGAQDVQPSTEPPKTEIIAPENIRKLIAVIHPVGDSKVRGSVMFEKVDEGVRVTANIGGLTPNGRHGFHIHEFGDLGAPDASSAGGHFNPRGVAHGFPAGVAPARTATEAKPTASEDSVEAVDETSQTEKAEAASSATTTPSSTPDRNAAKTPSSEENAGHEHGAQEDEHHPQVAEHHPGDMGNLMADENGTAHLVVVLPDVALDYSEMGILGRSVIVHSREDDGSQPTGNAGDRIGAGVIGLSKDAASE